MKKTKITTFIVAMFLCVSLFCGCAFAAENTVETKQPGTTAAALETTLETKKTAEPTMAAGKSMSVLFIGTSMLYYNNVPQMFKRLAQAADSSLSVKVYSLTYASRALGGHASAIKAVYDVKGDASKLTKKQKALFRFTRTKGDPGNYKKEVFEEYAKVLLTSGGKKRHFDYIVMQHNSGSYDYTEIKTAITSVINLTGDKNTTIILHMPNNQISASGNIKQQKTAFISNVASKDEKMVRAINSFASKGTKFKEAKVASAGLAFYNWLDKYGTDYAQTTVPGEYTRYKGNVETDLTVKNSPHPTQLGAYMVAAVFYSTITGKSAAGGAGSYKATVTSGGWNIRGLAEGKNYAGADAFNSTAILKKACEIANKTVNLGMR